MVQGFCRYKQPRRYIPFALAIPSNTNKRELVPELHMSPPRKVPRRPANVQEYKSGQIGGVPCGRERSQSHQVALLAVAVLG